MQYWQRNAIIKIIVFFFEVNINAKSEQRIYTYRTYSCCFHSCSSCWAASPRLIQNILNEARESVDLANVRSAYDELMIEAATENQTTTKVVPLKQKIAGWQSMNTVSIGGISHTNGEGDIEHWIGDPVKGGVCEVSSH